MKTKHKMLMEVFAEKAERLGYLVEVYPSDRRVYKISKGGKSVLTIGKHFPFNSIVDFEIVKRKDLTKRVLRDAGFPAPRGILTGEWKEVSAAIKTGKINFPLVTKPDTSLGGKMAIVKIENLEVLKKAFEKIRESYDEVLVEEFFPGEDFRFLVLDGKILAVARRVPPAIIGDGKTKISELVAKYNIGRGGDSLKLGFEVERVLAEQNLTINDIPSKGKKILMRRNANIHTGGVVEDVTNIVNPKFREMVLRAVKLFDLRFSGVDIICPDITKANSPYCIIELNTDPGYDLHWMDSKGHQYDATKDILKSLFS
ncbi:MAG: hypothetical protein ABSE04_04250 [Candidatus Microgenomates bacterium]|jgi:cyanophycin synthetase